MWTKQFWMDMTERVGSTFFFAFASSIVVTDGLGINDLKIAATAGLLSIAKAIAIGWKTNRTSD